ncbi:MAG: hypothetical protein WCP70_11010 [Methanothrix sp.]
MRVVARTPNDRAKAVVSTLVHGVVARFAEDHAVIDRCRPAELHVTDMVGLSPFAVTMSRTAIEAERCDPRAATRTTQFLAVERQLLRAYRKLIWSHRFANSNSLASMGPRLFSRGNLEMLLW